MYQHVLIVVRIGGGWMEHKTIYTVVKRAVWDCCGWSQVTYWADLCWMLSWACLLPNLVAPCVPLMTHVLTAVTPTPEIIQCPLWKDFSSVMSPWRRNGLWFVLGNDLVVVYHLPLRLPPFPPLLMGSRHKFILHVWSRGPKAMLILNSEKCAIGFRKRSFISW